MLVMLSASMICSTSTQVNATSGMDMEYIFSHSTFAGFTGYTDDPWGANQVT